VEVKAPEPEAAKDAGVAAEPPVPVETLPKTPKRSRQR